MASLGELLAADGFAGEEERPKRRQCPPPPPPRAGSMASYTRNQSSPSTRSTLRPSSSSRDEDSISQSLVDTSSGNDNNSTSFRVEDSRKSTGSEEIEEVFEGLDSDKYTTGERSYKLRYNNELYEDDQEASNEAPMKAVVSILTGYIARFLDDGRFRTSIRRRCASCLGPPAPPAEHSGPAGVLREAIATVERAVEGGAGTGTGPRDLKKASLKLSLVAGLDSSTELKGGHTSGVPNSHLAACAHLYLAAVYKFKDKDEVSAKHLLQVFSGCPNQARTVLLPELWDRLFLAHLSDLTDWYFEEVEAVGRRRRGGDGVKKLALVEEVYNSRLDMGTSQFAAYYKEWLAGEPPRMIPSVPVPDSSLLENPREASRTHGGGYHATVSRELYESVFTSSSSSKMERHHRAFEEWKREEEEEENILEEEEENENILVGEEEEHSLCSPDQLSSSDDDEWAARRSKARHRSFRTSLLPPWRKSLDV